MIGAQRVREGRRVVRECETHRRKKWNLSVMSKKFFLPAKKAPLARETSGVGEYLLPCHAVSFQQRDSSEGASSRVDLMATVKRRERTHSEILANEKSSNFFMYRFSLTKSKYEGTKMIVWLELTADLRSMGRVCFGGQRTGSARLGSARL